MIRPAPASPAPAGGPSARGATPAIQVCSESTIHDLPASRTRASGVTARTPVAVATVASRLAGTVAVNDSTRSRPAPTVPPAVVTARSAAERWAGT